MITVHSTCRRGAFALDIALDLEAGITGLFGASGAGKSTLLRSIAGLPPDAARVSIDGDALDALPTHRRRIGLVFQDDLLFPHLSVEANLLYGVGGQRPLKTRLPLERVVAGLGLGDLLNRRPRSLSGGERQRVALGRSLMPLPRLLLCDEPLSSLDVEARRAILPFLAGISRDLGLPMLYVSHDLGELLTLSERLVVLDRGRVAGHGSFDELRADERVRPLLYDEAVVRRLLDPS